MTYTLGYQSGGSNSLILRFKRSRVHWAIIAIDLPRRMISPCCLHAYAVLLNGEKSKSGEFF